MSGGRRSCARGVHECPLRPHVDSPMQRNTAEAPACAAQPWRSAMGLLLEIEALELL